MPRRNAIRRHRNLDEDQTNEALKVLERYCKTKYRQSVLLSQQDLDNIGDAPTPTSRPLSAFMPPSRQMTIDRQSTVFSFNPTDKTAFGLGMSLDFPEQSVKKEIIFDSGHETLLNYFSRVSKFFYHHFGLKHIVYVLLLVCYALIGGYIFLIIEAPVQMEERNRIKQEAVVRHREFSNLTVLLLYSSQCFSKLLNNSDASKQIDFSNSLCQQEINKVLKSYDERLKEDLGLEEGWTWDYWNAVFYAGTVFTTIGYGNLTCKTTKGRLITILYAIFGIPSMLVIMNIVGMALFRKVRFVWTTLKGKVRDHLRKRRYRIVVKKAMKQSMENNIDMAQVEIAKEIEEETSEEVDFFETFPMSLALLIVFVFIILSSFLFSFWEQWDIFTAFYFTFISMSTVGFGDVIPEHPKYACVLFFFYFIGLTLVSMCIAIIQARVEHKYMWALQLIDQENGELLEPSEYEKDEKCDLVTASQNDVNSEVRWRSRDLDPRTSYTRRSSVFIPTPGETPVATPPVLNAFMSKAMRSKRSSLMRSESLLSRSSRSSRFLFPNSPSTSELLTPTDSKTRSPWPNTAESPHPQSHTLNKMGSAPMLAMRNPASVPLSVITEVSDEDTLNLRRSMRRAASSIDESADRSTNEDHSEEIVIERPRRLQRATAEDLEAPSEETSPLSPNVTKL